jgi:hypothetical protein
MLFGQKNWLDILSKTCRLASCKDIVDQWQGGSLVQGFVSGVFVENFIKNERMLFHKLGQIKFGSEQEMDKVIMMARKVNLTSKPKSRMPAIPSSLCCSLTLVRSLEYCDHL